MSGAAVLEILAPGLFAAPPASAKGSGRKNALGGLLARADAVAEPGSSVEKNLYLRFVGCAEPEQDVPLAAFEMLGLDLKPGQGYWLKARAVRLFADRDRLILFPPEPNAGEKVPADSVVTAFNAHFADRGWSLLPARAPGNWYLQAPRPLALVTRSPAEATARSVDAYLPRGEDARLLRQLATETEMLFHQRMTGETDGEWNSLWFWGGGSLPSLPGKAPGRVATDDEMVAGMARHFGAALADPTELASDGAGRSLIFHGGLKKAIESGDEPGWWTALAEIESLANAAVENLRRRRFDEVRIGDGSAPVRRLDRRALRRWWRPKRDLCAFSETGPAG